MTSDAELEAIRRYVNATIEAADRDLARQEVEVEIHQLTTKALTNIVTVLEGLTEAVSNLAEVMKRLEKKRGR